MTRGGRRQGQSRRHCPYVSFGGTCYNCNQKGHRAFQSSQKKNASSNGNGNKNGCGNGRIKKHLVCGICDKIDHRDPNFWLKPPTQGHNSNVLAI
jgi:hypothetical protein